MSDIEVSRRIAESVDLRNQLPDVHFYESEQVVGVQEYKFQLPERHMSAAKAILKLTNSPSLSEVGLHGPSIAASSTEANRDVEDLNLYSALFPRDAHIVAYFLRERFPELTYATVMESLSRMGLRDSLRFSEVKDEQELGKVAHEIRDPESDPIAQKLAETKNFGFPYYGAIDTTPKNVRAINYLASKDVNVLKDEFVAFDGKGYTVEDGLRANISWLRRRMELNPEGLVEALWFNPAHHANQTWSDSPTSFHHADGSWARHHPDKNWGVAPVELQAEVYDALVGTSRTYSLQASGAEGYRKKKYLEDEIEDLTHRASILRKVVLEKFWVEDPGRFGGFFARGTDRDEMGNLFPLAIRSSDMGHLLNSEILDGDEPEVIRKREAVIKNLFSEEMLCPSGFRTLSSDSLFYGEERYHNGNSWPWQTYYIAKGLERHGYYGLAFEAKRLAWSLYNETKLLPEYGNGSKDSGQRLVERKLTVFDRTLADVPIYHFSLHQICQPPQEIQAWTAAAILAIKYEHGERLFHPEIAVPTKAVDEKLRAFEKVILDGLAA